MPLEINCGTSLASMANSADTADKALISGNSERKNRILSAFPSQAEAIGDLQQSDLQAEQSANVQSEAQPRRRGAPEGNQNNFRHGLYSKQLQKVKRGRLRGKAKKLAAETLQAVLQDQGPLDQIPTTLMWVCERFSRRVGRLRMLEHAVESLIERNPTVRDNGQVLAKLNSYLQPLEDATINDARLIGFQRVGGSKSIAEQIIAIEQQRHTNSND